MINVTYYRKYNRLTINGHAQSGAKGHDLVCAAASVLAYTLAANVGSLAELGQIRDIDISLEEGTAEISCNPTTRYIAVTKLIFDTICAGFEILAQDYPENIRYEVHS